MAGSGYYYDRYKEDRGKVNRLAGNISSLTQIKQALFNNFFDEQKSVNGGVDDLIEDLHRAVRHDSQFQATADRCHSDKEKAVTDDEDLSRVLDSIEGEISSLNTQKAEAERSRDANWRSYENAKEEEHRAWLESLKNVSER